MRVATKVVIKAEATPTSVPSNSDNRIRARAGRAARPRRTARPGPGGPNNNNPATNAISNANQLHDQQPPNPNNSPTFTTKTIVSYGRFLVEPTFTAPNTFGPGNQTVTSVPANDQALNSSATLRTQDGTNNGTLTVASAGSPTRALAVPWQQGGSGFSADVTSAVFGPLTGFGYVSAQGDAFAYVYKDQNNNKLGFFGGTPTSNSQLPSTGFASYKLYNLTPPGSPACRSRPKRSPPRRLFPAPTPPWPVRRSMRCMPTTPAPRWPSGSSFRPRIRASYRRRSPSRACTAASPDSRPTWASTSTSSCRRPPTARSPHPAPSAAPTASARTRAIGYLQSAASTASTGSGNAIYGTTTNKDAASFMVFTPDQVSGNVTVNGNNTITSLQTGRTTQAALDQTIVLATGPILSTIRATIRPRSRSSSRRRRAWASRAPRRP